MRARFLPRALLAVGGLLALSVLATCSFVVDLDPLSNGQCASDKKLCDDTTVQPPIRSCVALNIPKYGCAQAGCVTCTLLNATAKCTNGKCTIAACIGTNQDCDMDPSNGCEIDTDHDPAHCGSCNAIPCVVANATPDCSAGRCVVRSCNTGFGDCDMDATNGCESDVLSNVAHCGRCETPCAAGKTCQAGVCR